MGLESWEGIDLDTLQDYINEWYLENYKNCKKLKEKFGIDK